MLAYATVRKKKVIEDNVGICNHPCTSVWIFIFVHVDIFLSNSAKSFVFVHMNIFSFKQVRVTQQKKTYILHVTAKCLRDPTQK